MIMHTIMDVEGGGDLNILRFHYFYSHVQSRIDTIWRFLCLPMQMSFGDIRIILNDGNQDNRFNIWIWEKKSYYIPEISAEQRLIIGCIEGKL